MSELLDMVQRRYAMPGCVDSCCFRLPDTERYYDAYDTGRDVHYTVHEVTPHCAKDKERAGFRAAIYAEAKKQADDAADRCTTLRGQMRARQRAWEKATALWVAGPCPYFESRDGSES